MEFAIHSSDGIRCSIGQSWNAFNSAMPVLNCGLLVHQHEVFNPGTFQIRDHVQKSTASRLGMVGGRLFPLPHFRLETVPNSPKTVNVWLGGNSPEMSLLKPLEASIRLVSAKVVSQK
jgi:hypothetical protein